VIALLIRLALKLGIAPRFAKGAVLAGLFVAALLTVGGVVMWIRHDAVSDHEAKVERRARPATDKAADERARDTIHNAKTDQERHNVIKAQPDQPISPTSHALACRRLHDAGRDPPACR
jgi:hypothetical protein